MPLFRIYALLSQIRFCREYVFFWVCFVQTLTQTLRILLRFCVDICPKNWRLRPLVAKSPFIIASTGGYLYSIDVEVNAKNPLTALKTPAASDCGLQCMVKLSQPGKTEKCWIFFIGCGVCTADPRDYQEMWRATFKPSPAYSYQLSCNDNYDRKDGIGEENEIQPRH